MRHLLVLVPLVISAPVLADEHTFTQADDAAMSSCLDDLGAGAPADCIGEASNFCQEEPGGATTAGIGICLARETDWWDFQLNAHYESLEADLDAETFETLREAQRAWIDYRDANCAFAYKYWEEGSIRSVAHASCMLDETAHRALALEEVLGCSN
jgi:uncharacterized protein YecT (DUF1311 family)